MICCKNGRNFIRLLFLLTELFKFEIQKCGQILCAHKPYFLKPGHKYNEYTYIKNLACSFVRRVYKTSSPKECSGYNPDMYCYALKITKYHFYNITSILSRVLRW